MAQQLVASTKWKARGASKVGSQAYWKERIEGASGLRYSEYWTHISYYKLERIQALAEVDYRVLGREEPGAPDHRDNLGEEPPIYPPKYSANHTGGREYIPFAGKTSGSGLGSVQ